jgi:tetratricopeptide (TPR) repeat protein
MKKISKKVIHIRAVIIIVLLTVLISSISFAMDAPPVKKMNINQSIRKGIALYDKGEYEDALKHFMRLDKSYPDNGNVLYEIANAYYVLKDYKTALKYAENARDLLPEIDKLYILMGNIYDNLDNPEKAVTQYKKAAQINPDSESVYFNLGVACYNIRKYAEAENALNASLKINENNASTHYVLGFVYARLNETELAKSTFRKFLVLEKEGERSDKVRTVLKSIILKEQKI